MTAIKNLECRKDKIHEEMNTNFIEVSENLAIKMQGFKKYLVGSLQDLVETAKPLELSKKKDSKHSFQDMKISNQNNNLEIYFATERSAKQHLQIEKAIKTMRRKLIIMEYHGSSVENLK